MPRKRSIAARRRDEILTKLREGVDRSDIRESLGLDDEAFEVALDEALKALSSELKSRPSEHAYADYYCAGLRAISQLEKIAGDEKTQPRDGVSAIKAQWAVHKDLINGARDLGVIKVDGQTGDAGRFKDLLAELEALNSAQLRQRVISQNKILLNTMRQHGEGLDILDVDAGELYPPQ